MFLRLVLLVIVIRCFASCVSSSIRQLDPYNDEIRYKVSASTRDHIQPAVVIFITPIVYVCKQIDWLDEITADSNVDVVAEVRGNLL